MATSTTESKSQIPSLREMLNNGVHFGHVASRWNPKMKPYIFTERDKIHIIDLEQTRSQLERALHFLSGVVEKGGTVLFVGTKSQAKELAKKAANEAGMPYIVERWFGGTLTNFGVLRKNVKVLESMEKAETDGSWQHLTKKEQLKLNEKKASLLKELEGIRTMTELPNALLIVDAHKEIIAATEAGILGIPVVAFVDTNTNPHAIDYPIPANDDATKSLTLLLDTVSEHLAAAKTRHLTQKTAAAATAPTEKVTQATASETVVTEPKKTVAKSKATGTTKGGLMLDKIQRLREQTGLGIMDLKKALEEANGDEAKALELLKKQGVAIAAKRAERTTAQGIVTSYVHGGRIGALVELNCETDFVAKTEDFQLVAKEIAMQIASMNPQNTEELLAQPFIKEPTETIQDMLTRIIAKTGENIQIGTFSRIELGQ